MKRNHIFIIVYFIFIAYILGNYVNSYKETNMGLEFKPLIDKPTFTLEAFKEGEYQPIFEEYLKSNFYNSNEIKATYIRTQYHVSRYASSYFGTDNNGFTLVNVTSPIKVDDESNFLIYTSYYEERPSYCTTLNVESAKVNEQIEPYIGSIPVYAMAIDRKPTLSLGDDNFNEVIDINIDDVDCDGVTSIDKKLVRINLYNNMDELQENYYKTDHHANHKGLYSIYTQMINQLNDDGYNLGEPVEIENEICFDEDFYGSMARGSGYFKPEKPCAYEFSNVPSTRYINYVETPLTPDIKNDSIENPFFNFYGSYYGWDYLHVAHVTNRDELPNIVLFGDSFDNGILELLSNHFNVVVSVDMRQKRDSDPDDIIADLEAEYGVEFDVIIDTTLKITSGYKEIE